MTKQKFTKQFKEDVKRALHFHCNKINQEDLDEQMNYTIDGIVENIKLSNAVKFQIVPHGDFKQLNSIFEIGFDVYVDYKNGNYSKHYVFLIVYLEKVGE